ncbi:hypothetical protein M404DRAFT_1005619 [Pisolithus tinctorius Marx 270]|uniref:Uncharacterized protein n=1 Tax=Pisolithus tinctorius Marx 270 TaxID=870435 RepID=A0A0C3NRF0_PISTI|nr:hypothetical protein M404DRAFT_1005619 [Pisolithus tinctorius Marx 270]
MTLQADALFHSVGIMPLFGILPVRHIRSCAVKPFYELRCHSGLSLTTMLGGSIQSAS